MALSAQSAAKKPVILARLQLTAETATTTDQGYPSTVRVTLTNVGSMIVSLPTLGGDCHPNNGVGIQSSWSAEDGSLGGVTAGACGITDQPTLLERAKAQWIRLQPGEFMSTMLKLALPTDKNDVVITFWVEYTPPDALPQEIDELLQAGYVIPSQKLETEHRSFAVR